MTTYRTGRHWGITIVREQPIDGMTAIDEQLVAVIVNGDHALAERICELLNTGETRKLTTTGNPACGWCLAEGYPCPVHADPEDA